MIKVQSAQHSWACKRSAFTVPELLAVVAIIMIIISILLPSMEQARANARMTICQANIRSLAMATRAYTLDEGQYLPPVLIKAGVPGYAEGDVFSNLFVRRAYMTAVSGFDSRSPFRCPEQMVNKNVGSNGWAPTKGPHRTEKHMMYTYATGAADPTGTNPLPIKGVAVPTWYLLAGGNHPNWTFQWIEKQSDWLRTYKVNRVLNQSEKVLAAEQSNINATSPNDGGYGEGRIAARHGPFVPGPLPGGLNDGRANIVFFDGHVAAFNTDQWYSGLTVPGLRYLFNQ